MIILKTKYKPKIARHEVENWLKWQIVDKEQFLFMSLTKNHVQIGKDCFYLKRNSPYSATFIEGEFLKKDASFDLAINYGISTGYIIFFIVSLIIFLVSVIASNEATINDVERVMTLGLKLKTIFIFLFFYCILISAYFIYPIYRDRNWIESQLQLEKRTKANNM
ncbi:MAG: hypothetical protein R2730_12520 [Chitinophagales bacterium]